MKQKKELIALADGFFNSQDYHRALEYYNQLLGLDPKSSKAHEGIGLCYFALLQIDQAIEHINLAILHNAKNHNAYYNRGRIRRERKELELAVKDFETAIAIYGDQIDYLTHCAEAHLALKNYPKVVTFAQRLLNIAFHDLYAMDYMAAACLELKRYNEALLWFHKLLQREPGNAFTHNNIGFTLLKLGKYKEAITQFDKAIGVQPEFSYPYDNRGFCKFKLGKVKAGLKDIIYALRLDPSNAYAYKFRGIIYQSQGKPELAKQDYLKALELGYSDKYDDEVGQLLSNMDIN